MMEVLQSDLPNDLDDSQYYVIRKLLAAVTRVFYSDAMPAKAIWPLLYPKRERQIMRDNPAMGTIFLDEDERPIRKAECGLSSTLLRDLKQACAKFKQAFPSASGDLSDTLVRCPELLVAEGMSPGDSLRCGLDVNHKGEHVSKDGQRWNTDSTVDVAKAKTRKTGPGKKVKIPKPEEVEEAGDVPDGLVTDADADFEAAFAKEMGD